MKPLRITTCQAANTFEETRQIAEQIERELGIPTELVDPTDWDARYTELDRGELDIAWICSLPYAHRAHRPDAAIELLAAPIEPGERYRGRAVYFSDVIVRHDSDIESFEELKGKRWTFNEPHSHSGYHVVRYHLNQKKLEPPFFGEVFASGGHVNSIEMVLNGTADGSAIDSTVLDWYFEERPGLKDQLRIIESIGPSPIPPLVISKSVDPTIRDKIRKMLTDSDRFTFQNSPDYSQTLAMYILARNVIF